MQIDQFKAHLCRTDDDKYFRLWHISAIAPAPDGTFIHLNGGFALITSMPIAAVIALIERTIAQ